MYLAAIGVAVVLTLLFGVCLVVLGVVLFWRLMNRPAETEGSEPWLVFADKHNLSKVRGAPILRGVVQGHQVEVRLMRMHPGKRRAIWTSLVVQGVPGDLTLEKGGLYGENHQVVSDPAFAGVAVRLRKASAMARLSSPVRQLLAKPLSEGRARLKAGRLVIVSGCRQSCAGLEEMLSLAVESATLLKATTPVVPALVEMAHNDDDEQLRMEALHQLYRLDPEALNTALASSPDQDHERVKLLVALKEENWSAVAETLADSTRSDTLRWDALLGVFSAEQEPITRCLTSLWTSKPSALHVRAMREIVNKRLRQARDGVLSMADAMSARQTVDPWSRESALLSIHVVTQMGANHGPSEGALMQYACMPEPKLQAAACRGLGEIGGLLSLDLLKTLSASDDSDVAQQAQAAVQAIVAREGQEASAEAGADATATGQQAGQQAQPPSANEPGALPAVEPGADELASLAAAAPTVNFDVSPTSPPVRLAEELPVPVAAPPPPVDEAAQVPEDPFEAPVPGQAAKDDRSSE